MRRVSAFLIRLSRCSRQTLGRFYVFDDTTPVFEATTLELPWRDNQKAVSCIPSESIYTVTKRYSPKYKDHWLIESVPGRSYILIHAGNKHDHTKGCVLLGSPSAGHTHDIDGDGLQDIVSSRRTILRLNAVMDELGVEKFHLRVIN